MTRLQRFRAFISAMNPSTGPASAIKQGYYVDPPGGGVWSKLTRRLALEPTSTHLVLGGSGSGKTSELLRAHDELQVSLQETKDFVNYCDVSRHHDLSLTPPVGVLFALTGIKLLDKLNAKAKSTKAATELRNYAEGSFVWVPDEPYDDEPPDYDEPPGQTVHFPGVLKPPPAISPISWSLAQQVPNLRDVLLNSPGRTAIMLFDSLDRLPDPAAFKRMVAEDIRALKSVGVGVVVVGPIRFMVGNDRSLTDLFDQTHFQLAQDPDTDEGERFLCDVLRRRSEAGGLLPEEYLPLLARASGGMLRDLIALAKRSAEEAYANGHATILLDDIARASDAFGRSLAIGLDDDQVKILHTVAESGRFVVRNERELSLLETRRVLLYPGNRWAVHPTLAGLLQDVPEVQG